MSSARAKNKQRGLWLGRQHQQTIAQQHEQNEKERGPLRLWFRPLTPNPYCVLVVVFIVYGAVQALLAAKRVSGVVT